MHQQGGQCAAHYKPHWRLIALRLAGLCVAFPAILSGETRRRA